MTKSNMTPRPLLERILPKIKITGDCWEWKSTLHHGTRAAVYMKVGGKGKLLFAARVIYEMSYGKIPPGMLVCHRCDNPKCVKPTHLFLGTLSDNSIDMVQKGRHPRLNGTHTEGVILIAKDVLEIREQCARGVNQRELAKAYGVSPSMITMIKNRTTWKHI